MHEIPKADAYGVVIFNARDEVLLREPLGNFGGSVWTFAEGRPDRDETPEETAVREAFDETGYRVELLGVIPQIFLDTDTSSAFFIAGPLGKQGKLKSETKAACWFLFEKAVELLSQTESEVLRERDLAILYAAKKVKDRLPWDRQPATCKEDWETKPFPRKRVNLTLDLSFDETAMGRIRRGFLPMEMEEKWFAWFHEPVLHLHRSWTGFCIYQVRFQKDANRWRAVSAKVNRNPEQYTETDDAMDQRLIANLIDDLLVNGSIGPRNDTFSEILIQAAKPNYLGSPEVVSEIIQRILEAAISYFDGEISFKTVWNLIVDTGLEIAEGNKYVRMPGWHTPQGLGQALVMFMGVRREEVSDDNLGYFLSEALFGLFLTAHEMLCDFNKDPVAEWNAHAVEQLNQIHHWSVQVFLGTNELEYPRVTMSDFRWRKITVE